MLAGVAIPLMFAAGIGYAADEPKPCDGQLIPVSGKIFNNALGPGETLGVVHMSVETEPKATKLKCGLHGTAYFLPPDQNDPLSFLPRFTHKIVCDDPISDLQTGIHSQLNLDTHFEVFSPTECCDPSCTQQAFSFVEASYPQSGRGLFAAEGGGSIFVEGSLNCSGAIDMNYSGDACLAP